MEPDDREDDDEFVEVSIPTALIGRLIHAISDVMIQWEAECKAEGGEFNALIGVSAAHMAVDFIDKCMDRMPNETVQ